jgi:hypothetical protein
MHPAGMSWITSSTTSIQTFGSIDYEDVMRNPEQVYADVNVILTESLLRVEADGESAMRIRAFGSALLRDETVSIPGAQECKAIAALLVLRFGDRRSLPLLLKCVEDDSGRNPPSIVRSCAFVYASFGLSEYRGVQASCLRARFRRLFE